MTVTSAMSYQKLLNSGTLGRLQEITLSAMKQQKTRITAAGLNNFIRCETNNKISFEAIRKALSQLRDLGLVEENGQKYLESTKRHVNCYQIPIVPIDKKSLLIDNIMRLTKRINNLRNARNELINQIDLLENNQPTLFEIKKGKK